MLHPDMPLKLGSNHREMVTSKTSVLYVVTTSFLVCFFLAIAPIRSPLYGQERPVWRIAHERHNPDPGFFDVACADSLNCIVSCRYGAGIESCLLGTTDGGESWTTVYRDTANNPRRRWPLQMEGVAYPSRDLAIVVADSGYILRSTDGGATWEERQTIVTTNAIDRGPISMCDHRHGVIVWRWPVLDSIGTPDFLMVTDDGGMTWDTLPSRPEPSEWEFHYIYNVACPAPGHYVCLLLGPAGESLVAVTKDRVRTWERTENPLPVKARFVSGELFFLDADVGFWATAQQDKAHSVFARTEDGGQTWQLVHNDSIDGVNGALFSLSFRDRDNGIAGGLGWIFRTSDGGYSWSRDSVERVAATIPVSAKVRWIGEQRGIAVADFSLIRIWNPSASAVEEELVAPHHESALALYPNPAVGGSSPTVRLNLLKPAAVRLEVFTVTGKKVMHLVPVPLEAGLQETRLDMSALPAGAYMVRVSWESTTLESGILLLP